MIAAAENCMRIARAALAQAAEWEVQREPVYADVLGSCAASAVESALVISATQAAFERQFPPIRNTQGQRMCPACFGVGQYSGLACEHCNQTGLHWRNA